MSKIMILNGKLNEHGIETEFLYLGLKPMAGCIACGKCRNRWSNKMTSLLHICMGSLDSFLYRALNAYAKSHRSNSMGCWRLSENENDLQFTAGLSTSGYTFNIKAGDRSSRAVFQMLKR